jgi:5'-deoxynucleotidase YfbR-like HD superfamily hydrolase
LKEINNNLEKDKIFLFSLNEILNNKDYEKYLSHIRRLSHSMRWSGIQRKYPISVMSHLIIVTFISYCLANIEGKNESEVYEIMLKSVYHDIPEAIT